ncbi:MAG TPA: hypothetical protein P5135_02070, partial [Gemmatimonadales bacterium]|nr:hypothetical protein [Gemmatimonadales bacterium]
MHRRPFVQAALAGLLGPRAVRAAAASRPVAATDATEGWSFVLLPDTQCYSESHPEVFLAQTEWIARQRHARNIRFVLHLGDITNNNVLPEWINARRAM